jgi:hypothetical protein
MSCQLKACWHDIASSHKTLHNDASVEINI